jgi:hypothetical protein
MQGLLLWNCPAVHGILGSTATKNGLEVHKGGKDGLWPGIFAVILLLKEGLHENSEFMLKRRVWGK